MAVRGCYAKPDFLALVRQDENFATKSLRILLQSTGKNLQQLVLKEYLGWVKEE